MREIRLDGTAIQAARFVARNPYAWPGGYDVALVMDDGGILCANCVRENYAQITHDTRYEWLGTCWGAAGLITSEWIDESTLCDSCYRELCPYIDETDNV